MPNDMPVKPAETDDPRLKAGIRFAEFIALMALMTSMVALSIDMMLPALPAIGAEYGLGNDNDRQLIIVVFSISLGISQFFFGPLADRFGRKPVAMASLGIYVAASLLASFAPSFELLLVARALQAVGASGVRITTMAIVRDCFEGREMARVMSYIFTTFMIVPIVAPMVGQGILFIAEWHAIFLFLTVGTGLLAVWAALRLTETLDPLHRRALSFASFGRAAREIATTRVSAGYAIAITLFYSAMFSFIVSIQQVYDTIYGLGTWFAVAFAAHAVGMSVASFLNGRAVRQVGMRRMSHGAMLSYIGFTLALFLWSRIETPPFWAAFALISGALLSFVLITGNFNSIAMQPLGHVAGTAASLIGTLTYTVGAVLGGLVGAAFDGTIGPLSLALVAFSGLAALIVSYTERGTLFGDDQH